MLLRTVETRESRDSGEESVDPLRISIIVPVYNGAKFLEQSLRPLSEMKLRGEVFELIVMDDGSEDNSGEVAAAMGAQVFSTGGRKGVSTARNRAVERAAGEIVWFVDADVVVHADAAQQVRDAFVDSSIVAVFGSYDDQPPAQNFFSQYKNLVHHYYHQRASEEASTFWAGCGAVRRAYFRQVGGFDEARYPMPSIEDIELGYRLRAQGARIKLVPNLRCTHLKEWRLGNLLHTEVFRRALPWSRLMLERGSLTDDLNVGTGERLRAFLAVCFAICIAAASVGFAPWWSVVIGTLVIGGANFDLLKLFAYRKGPLFSLGGLMFHQVYYLYSSAAFVWSWFQNRVIRQVLSWSR